MKNIKTFENFNNQDIFDYIRTGDIESIKNYIDSGYDLNIWDNRGYTVLTKAAYYDNINKQDHLGYTALIWAASINNREVIEVLLTYGADVSILNKKNKSFYDYLNDGNKNIS